MWNGKEDEELLKIAYEDNRFVLTHDSDFGTLAIYKGKKYHGIIYVKVKNLQSQNVIKVCRQLLELKTNIKPGALIVAEESKLRIRHIAVD